MTLLSFVDVPQQRPYRRLAEERRRDFREIYDEFIPASAVAQASRCSQCGVPFCQIHCPLHNNIPDWLALTAEGRLEEAYAIASATNTFPEICGRICPHDRLCEGHCVIEKGFDSVTIGTIERFITETAFDNGWVSNPEPASERGQSVGIVGAGPAGLAAADRLRRYGYRVDVYDRHDRAGGLLMYGIPDFKLEKHVVARRVDLLVEGGVTFHPETDIGRDLAFADLRDRHDAVLLATGVYKARDIQAPGIGLDGIVPALDYLIASNRRSLGMDVTASAVPDAAGHRVVVVGGGDTAMDCVRTAVRQGAQAVTCLYRRDRDNMPGSQREVSYAIEEGVMFEFLCVPEAFDGDDRVATVKVSRMCLGDTDSDGRRQPLRVEDKGFGIETTLVLKALGFDPEPVAEMFSLDDLDVEADGTVKTEGLSGRTSVPRVWAAGDIARGASLVVWAIRDARQAADSIHQELGAS